MKTVQVLRYDQMPRADRVWHLKQTALMEGLSDADFEVIASSCTDRIYKTGEIIFDLEDPVDSLYILNRGTVRISLSNDSGREKILGVLGMGAVFGTNLLEEQGYSDIQATAHEECWVSIISREVFIQLIQQRTSIALNYIKVLTGQLAEAREDLTALSFLNSPCRLGKALVQLAKEHGRRRHTDNGWTKLKIVMSHEQLARLIGGNRPHVSMIMSRFKKNGWINYEGRKLLINVEKLNQLVHAEGTFCPDLSLVQDRS